MDVNGTRLHVLLGEDDWHRDGVAGGTPPAGVSWDGETSAVTLRRLPVVLAPRPGDRPPTLADRRGAARDRFGNVYWVDAARTSLMVQLSGDRTVHRFWTPGVPARPDAHGAFEPVPPGDEECEPPLLGGATVTSEHFLLVGTERPSGLLHFDLRSGGPPRAVRWPAAIPFAPWDLAALPDGGAVVLDRVNRQLWQLDRQLQVVPLTPVPAGAPPRDDFAPVEGPAAPPAGVPAPRSIAAIAPGDAAVIDADAVAVAALPDATVLVVHRRPAGQASLVRRLRDGVPVGPPARLADDAANPPLRVRAHAAALVGMTLFVAAAGGDQAWAFAVDVRDDALALTLEARALPMRLYEGRGLVAGSDAAHYDTGGRWVPLVEHRARRFTTAATIVTRVLDGREPGCTWHRVLLDACVPPQTAVRVAIRAADERDALDGAPWAAQPLPLRRPRPELPWVDPPGGEHWGTLELLVQQVRGRFAQVRIELLGDGRHSPHLRALRVYYPRFSYLDRYLPALYREDHDSASFLDRFLANPEGLLTELEDRIVSAQALLDPRATPASALGWLAEWFGMMLDPAWDESRQRLFLRHAMTFLRLRGTPLGLRLALRLALDRCVDERVFTELGRPSTDAYRIVEWYGSRGGGGAARRWRPGDGAEALHRRWREAVGTSTPEERFPLAAPEGREQTWDAFARGVLGFIPPGTPPAGWSDFLERRHGRPAALARSWSLAVAPTSFAAAPWPVASPDDGGQLEDWYDFCAEVIARRHGAHRFTVLLPVPVAGDEPPGAREERDRAIAERVIELQKPAHTLFDVRFYWSAFRVGEARVGTDTVIGLGSRSGRLLAQAVLGRGHLGEAQLGGEAYL